MNYYSQELYHHGILGMRWGKKNGPPYPLDDKHHSASERKAGWRKSLNNAEGSRKVHERASNYSEQQRQRDRKIYGKGAEKRINQRMLNGESIQSARHNEVVRKKRTEDAKAIGKTTVKAALAIGGSVAVYKYLQKKGFSSTAAASIGEEAVRVGRQVVNAMFR